MSYTDIKTLSIQFADSLVIDELNQCGLVKGASGSLILLMQTYKLCANKELLCKLYKIVDQLIDTWDHNYTLGYGITGLAWCYGDLMAGYAIYKAGVLLENYEWKSIGVNLLEKSTLRTDIHEDCLAFCDDFNVLEECLLL